MTFAAHYDILTLEETEDVYSCTFDAKGRRLFKAVTYSHLQNDKTEELLPCDLEMAIDIAVKKAELLKLSKKEIKTQHNNCTGAVPSFFQYL